MSNGLYPGRCIVQTIEGGTAKDHRQRHYVVEHSNLVFILRKVTDCQTQEGKAECAQYQAGY